MPRLARWSEDYVWKNADIVLPVTGVLAGMIAERGVCSDQIRVIPNGISASFGEDLPDRAVLDKRYGLAGKLVLGFVGFVREWHGLDRVLRVIAENRDEPWHLLLAGDGPDRQRLEIIARDLGIDDRLTVTGIIDRQAMPEFIQRFDIALQPDVVEYASPLKLFEYLAMGRPVIAPDTENIREILTDEENALLFDPANDSFSRKLSELCTDAELREALGRAAHRTIGEQKLLWDENARRIAQCFENQMRGSNNATDRTRGGSLSETHRAGRGAGGTRTIADSAGRERTVV